MNVLTAINSQIVYNPQTDDMEYWNGHLYFNNGETIIDTTVDVEYFAHTIGFDVRYTEHNELCVIDDRFEYPEIPIDEWQYEITDEQILKYINIKYGKDSRRKDMV